MQSLSTLCASSDGRAAFAGRKGKRSLDERVNDSNIRCASVKREPPRCDDEKNNNDSDHCTEIDIKEERVMAPFDAIDFGRKARELRVSLERDSVSNYLGARRITLESDHGSKATKSRQTSILGFLRKDEERNAVETPIETNKEARKRFECADCEYSANWKHQLRRHIQFEHATTHEAKDYSECRRCGARYKCARQCRHHRKRICARGKIFKCAFCYYRTKYQGDFRKHLRMHAKHTKGKKVILSADKSNVTICEDGRTESANESHGSLVEPGRRIEQVTTHTVVKESEYRQLAEYHCSSCDTRHDAANTRNVTKRCPSCDARMSVRCKSCSRKYSLYCGFHRHLKRGTCSLPRFFSCDVCERKFESQWHLRKHIAYGVHIRDDEIARSARGDYECARCGRRWKERRTFLSHLKRCSTGETLLSGCALCEYRASDRSDLRLHLKERHNLTHAQMFERANEDARDRATAAALAKTKVKSEDAEESNAAAAITLNVSTRNLLKTEKMMALPMMATYCPSCDLTSKVRMGFNSKKCERCQTRNRFRCLKCPKDFSSRDCLGRHVKSEHLLIDKRERAYECDNCGKRYTFEEQYQGHRKKCLKLDEPLRCDYCRFATVYRTSLEYHVQIQHLGLKIQKNHRCDKCRARFVGADELEAHRKVDCTVGVYLCNECGAKFRSKATLIDHIRLKEIA